MCLVRSCTGVADHRVFVFNVMQAPPAIEPYATWKFLNTSLDFPNCLLGKRNDIGWCAETPSPKSASLGWEFGSSCFVGGLWFKSGLAVCLFRLVVGVCLVVAVTQSITCFFIHSHWWTYEKPEGINSSLSFLFRLSGNSRSPSKRYFPAG